MRVDYLIPYCPVFFTCKEKILETSFPTVNILYTLLFFYTSHHFLSSRVTLLKQRISNTHSLFAKYIEWYRKIRKPHCQIYDSQAKQSNSKNGTTPQPTDIIKFKVQQLILVCFLQSVESEQTAHRLSPTNGQYTGAVFNTH